MKRRNGIISLMGALVIAATASMTVLAESATVNSSNTSNSSNALQKAVLTVPTGTTMNDAQTKDLLKKVNDRMITFKNYEYTTVGRTTGLGMDSSIKSHTLVDAEKKAAMVSSDSNGVVEISYEVNGKSYFPDPVTGQWRYVDIAPLDAMSDTFRFQEGSEALLTAEKLQDGSYVIKTKAPLDSVGLTKVLVSASKTNQNSDGLDGMNLAGEMAFIVSPDFTVQKAQILNNMVIPELGTVSTDILMELTNFDKADPIELPKELDTATKMEFPQVPTPDTRQ